MKTTKGGVAGPDLQQTDSLSGTDTSTLEKNDGGSLRGARQMRFSNQKSEAIEFTPVSNIEGLNRHIVELLQEDGRATFSSIAKKLDVSEATVRSRVARMRESNLIHFITVANPVALGYSAWAMLGIKVSNQASAVDVARYFRDQTEVVYAMRVASRYDLLAEIVCETPDDLRDFLDTHCYGQPSIASVEPMIGLGLYKSLFKWEEGVGDGTKEARTS